MLYVYIHTFQCKPIGVDLWSNFQPPISSSETKEAAYSRASRILRHPADHTIMLSTGETCGAVSVHSVPQ